MKFYDEQTQTWKDVQIKVANAIKNEYGESNNDGYSQNYLNDKVVNVSNEVDEDYRTNILHSKNLFNKNTNVINAAIDSGTGVMEASSNFRTIYFECKPNTTYTFSKSVSSNRYVVGFSSSFITTGTLTNIKITETFTTPNTAKYCYIMISKVSDETSSITDILNSIMVNEGSSALEYEPYITPSINVDGETIYQRPVVLWQNPSPTSNFAGQAITLNDSLLNYEYYEINYKLSASSSVCISTGKIPVGLIAYLQVASNNNMRRYAEPNSAGTQITIGGGEVISTYGSSATTDNSRVIPYQVIGYGKKAPSSSQTRSLQTISIPENDDEGEIVRGEET